MALFSENSARWLIADQGKSFLFDFYFFKLKFFFYNLKVLWLLELIMLYEDQDHRQLNLFI